MTLHQKAITGLIKRFPSAANQTLARVAFKESPEIFDTVEHARAVIRRLRGASGKDAALGGQYAKAHGKPGDPFGTLPEGLTQFDSWGSVQFDGPLRCLVLPDIHAPFHNKAAVLTALRYGRERAADTVLLNGDAIDFFSVSFWEKDPKKRDFAGEIKTGRELFKTIREGFPKAKIILKEGNHEERFPRYMRVRAPELLGCADFELPAVFKLADQGIQFISEKRPIRLGKLNIVHGHEYNFPIANPVNPARGYFLRAKAHCMGSHLHQSSQHSEKDIEQHVVSTWSTGCLCDLHPEYRPLNAWNHGFAFVEVDKAGAFEVSNLKIIGGKVY